MQTEMHLGIIATVFLSLIVFALSDLTVRTNDGIVKGSPKGFTHSPGSISVFYGIPYAKPPVGDLRFRKPQSPTPWTGVLDATKKQNSCIQTPFSKIANLDWYERYHLTTDLSEDCLYLNVWTPAKIINGTAMEKDLAVIFWIHGGGFTTGGSATDIYDGSYITHKEFVVFVSINYRVGTLGFLYLNNEEVPGNMGLYDMVMALDWVKNNIHAFGGDPNLVTIIGESAGGASVSALLLSPLSRDKFKYAVIQSGSMLSPWSHKSKEESLALAKSISIEVNCTEADSINWDFKGKSRAKVVDCLRNTDANALNAAMYTARRDGKKTGNIIEACTPTIDGHFFPASPLEMLASKNFKNDTKIMSGHTSKEGAIFALGFPGYKYFSVKGDSFITKEQARELMKLAAPKLPEIGIDFLQYVYSDWTRPGNSTNHRDEIVDLLGDFHIVCSNLQFVKDISNDNTVYYYQFNHRPNINKKLPMWTGAMHTDEIQFFFGSVFNRSYDFNGDDKKMSETMMKHLAAFARNGKPEKEWPAFTSSEQVTHVYGFHKNEILGPRARQCAFFNEVLPKLGQCGLENAAKQLGASTAGSLQSGLYNVAMGFIAIILCMAQIV